MTEKEKRFAKRRGLRTPRLRAKMRNARYVRKLAQTILANRRKGTVSACCENCVYNEECEYKDPCRECSFNTLDDNSPNNWVGVVEEK